MGGGRGGGQTPLLHEVINSSNAKGASSMKVGTHKSLMATCNGRWTHQRRIAELL